MRTQAPGAGLSLTAVAGHADLLEPDADVRAANIARIKATLDLVADLAGTPSSSTTLRTPPSALRSPASLASRARSTSCPWTRITNQYGNQVSECCWM
jgi:sugar phosphate isomerase/epimerase